MLATERPTLPLDQVAACHRCSTVPVPKRQHGDWWVLCSDCYDGAPDGNNELGTGHSRKEAIDGWNHRMGVDV